MPLTTDMTLTTRTKVIQQLQKILEIVPEYTRGKLEHLEVKILNTKSETELQVYYIELEKVYREYIKIHTLPSIH